MVAPRKKLESAYVRLQSVKGKNTEREYLLVKAHVNDASFYQAFTAVQLKEAVFDINGWPDRKDARKDVNSHQAASRIWKSLSGKND
jgi:hypothetical protein